jgi:hypothetical protein
MHPAASGPYKTAPSSTTTILHKLACHDACCAPSLVKACEYSPLSVDNVEWLKVQKNVAHPRFVGPVDEVMASPATARTKNQSRPPDIALQSIRGVVLARALTVVALDLVSFS